MTIEVEINGRLHAVTIEAIDAVRTGGRFRITIAGAEDGQPAPASRAHASFEVDARPTDLGVSFLYAGDGRSVDAAVTDRSGGEYLIDLPHLSLGATVNGRAFRHAASHGHAGEEQRVIAPMPGRVVRVLVKPGDEVAAGQPLLVIEAMKMENELVAARGGTVREVGVAEGASVETGRLLVRLV